MIDLDLKNLAVQNWEKPEDILTEAVTQFCDEHGEPIETVLQNLDSLSAQIGHDLHELYEGASIKLSGVSFTRSEAENIRMAIRALVVRIEASEIA